MGGIAQPSAPPTEFSTGYARILLVDGKTGENITSSGIHVIYSDNITAWDTNITTGEVFYVSRSSLWWANVSGYYPVSNALFAKEGSAGDPYDNVLYIFKRADPNDVYVELTKYRNMDDGIYNYSGKLPQNDGVYELDIFISINMPSRNTSVFGGGEWTPNYTLPTNSYAYNLSINFESLWLGWNATLHEYQFVSIFSSGYEDVYNITELQCTSLPETNYEGTYRVLVNVTNLQGIYVYDGIVDNYNNYVALLT
jgi:hypothetical protein